MNTQPLNWPTILRIQPDKIRHAARTSAWYGPSFNPFQKRMQNRPTRSNSMQLEDGLSHAQTLDDLPADQQRRQEMNDGITVPEYSNTFPPEFAGGEHQTHKSPPEPSMASQDPINVSSVRGIDSVTVGSVQAQARQRKSGILGKFKHRHDNDEWEDKKSLSSNKSFTFASQLRATILNSWINVLLIAAPVGSMFCSSCWLFMFGSACANSILVQLRSMPLEPIRLRSSWLTSLLSCKRFIPSAIVEDVMTNGHLLVPLLPCSVSQLKRLPFGMLQCI